MYKRIAAVVAASTLLVSIAMAQDSSSAASNSASSAASAKQAPDFSLSDADGKTHSLANLKGKVVVLEWTNSGCPFVQRHYKAGTMNKVAQKYADQGVVWLAVDSSADASKEKEAEFAKKHNVGHPVLIDSDGRIGKAFGAKTTPHIFVIGKEGNIVYDGAIDDDPGGDKAANARNYADEAIKAALDGKKPEIASTQAYGCGVKYKK